MPSDLERAVRWSKRFEAALTRRHGATGRGLHEKVDSARGHLDEATVRALRLVATVRNRIVHEEGYDRIDDRKRFNEAVRRARRGLGMSRRRWPLVVGAALVAIAALLVARVVL